MTQEQKWLSYVAELRSKHGAEMHEYGKELQGKILDQEFTIKSLVEDNRALKEAIEINCNCNADGCHQAKLLQDKDYQIQEAWERVHTLEDDLHNSETEKDKLVSEFEDLKRYDNTLESENRSHIDTINGQEYRIMELEKEKNEAFELLAQCTLRRNASEMRIEELKKQLMLMQIKLNDKEDLNDGKSGNSKEWSV